MELILLLFIEYTTNIILQYISRHVYNKNNNINIEYGNNLKCVINMRVNNIIIEIDIYIEIKIYV